ncbi:MAG TPA: peptidoglycan editing factor PgeF [Rhodospirillaceae bacterium]|nr:peptidoglycan editing factor PgeF [Rhodospirillaceae bacterium]
MIDFLKADTLAALPSITHGFFTRQGGVSQHAFASLNGDFALADDRLFVIENRKRVCKALRQPMASFLACRQVHSCDVLPVSFAWDSKHPPVADAMVTKKSGVVLAILTADCAPILFADEKAGVIGAAHAGWRGALGGIIENTVHMMERLGATRGDIVAAVGPCIWQDSYEVSADFLIPFLDQDKQSERFFKIAEKRGHYQFDLPAYVATRLQTSGVGTVEASPADTFPDQTRFYSYRRHFLQIEINTGRQMSAIALR